MMSCLGMHFALSEAQYDRLVSLNDNADVIRFIQEDLEEKWDEAFLYETDKAWDAIHRCLTDGDLGFDNGTYPLNAAILGGKQLYDGDEYIVSLLSSTQVKEVSAALQNVSLEFFKENYFKIDEEDYFDISEDDLEYTLDYFVGLVAFFKKIADKNMAIVFSVDQ